MPGGARGFYPAPVIYSAYVCMIEMHAGCGVPAGCLVVAEELLAVG